VRTKPVARPKLGALIPVIDAILEADRTAPVKQRHTAKRIFERLRDEHGYGGGLTVVKDYVRIARGRQRETFVPLAHPPGHAQVDFGEAVGVIGGVRQKIHFFCMDLPQSDAPFVKGYPAETTEAFIDGHVSAFAFFGGLPLSILYDNTTSVALAFNSGRSPPASPVRLLGVPRQDQTDLFLGRSMEAATTCPTKVGFTVGPSSARSRPLRLICGHGVIAVSAVWPKMLRSGPVCPAR